MINSELSILRKAETAAVNLHLRSDGIVHLIFKPIEELSIDNALETFEMAGILSKGKKIPTLITAHRFMNIENEVRKLWADGSVNRYSKAEALVLKNVAVKLIGNFYIQINKPSMPTQMFTAEEPAVEWLTRYV